ncbi:hypothetical protein D9758_014415 [Tetrapyrgos nigripes]|uniref:WD40 repeat-like protein n=1 Tax=Tetrapyrgos nigripes TaxID=182062 RepID=A0A8H5FPX8_9AGAR|nr:hypothetical protein D9758_014415 [Tetrapyrgos nigripes]
MSRHNRSTPRDPFQGGRNNCTGYDGNMPSTTSTITGSFASQRAQNFVTSGFYNKNTKQFISRHTLARRRMNSISQSRDLSPDRMLVDEAPNRSASLPERSDIRVPDPDERPSLMQSGEVAMDISRLLNPSKPEVGPVDTSRLLNLSEPEVRPPGDRNLPAGNNNRFFQNASYSNFQGNTFNAVGRDQNIQNHYAPQIVQNINYGQQISQDTRQNDLIHNMPRAKHALYDANDGKGQIRKACTEGTRTEILSEIVNWAIGNSRIKTLGYWVCGMAGTGKSTIAMSVCIELAKQNWLGATFFCNRQIPECRDHSLIIPTIAYQLAHHLQAFAEALLEILKKEPEAFSKPPSIQLNLLLMTPWKKISSVNMQTAVVVIDALDECEHISSVLSGLIPAINEQSMPGLKFFFTSRPQGHIQRHLKISRPLPPGSQVEGMFLHDVEEELVKADIAKFIKEEFEALTIPEKDMYINKLAEKSGKLFIYAATMVRYIKDYPEYVEDRLSEIFKPTSAPEENQTGDLDDLYHTVIEVAISTNRRKLSSKEFEERLMILHTIAIVGRPVSCFVISGLLGLKIGNVEGTVTQLQSVLYIGHTDKLVYTFHASFRDYILTQSRAGSDYVCNPLESHSMLSRRCFDTLTKLKFNICDLPSSFLADKDVPGIEQKLQNIDDTLRYACNYWGYHLAQSSMDAELDSQVTIFLKKRLMFWIEGMNLIGDLANCSEIILSLEKVEIGLENITKVIWDIQNFLTYIGSSDVKEMTPHLYLSLLPFWPYDFNGKLELNNIIKFEKRVRQQSIGYWKMNSTIHCMDFSSDGKMLAFGLNGGIIGIMNLLTGKYIQELQGHTHSISSVAFSPDGTKVASGSEDSTLRLWDVATGSHITEPLQGHTDSVESVAFSPDGTKLASGSQDSTLRLWDVATGTQITEPLQGNSYGVNSVAFSPDGTKLASGSYDKTLRLWDVATGSQITDPLQGHTDSVYSVAFSPDGTKLASGSGDQTLRLWDVATGTQIKEPLQGHTNWVKSVAFSPDGTKVASGSYDNTLRLWDVATGSQITEPLQGHTDSVESVAFSPDGTKLASGSYDNTLRLWDLVTGTQITEPLQGHTYSVESVASSPDGTKLASGSNDNTLRLWGMATGTQITEPLQSHTYTVYSVAFSPDGTKLASGSNDNTLRLWDVATGTQITEPLQGHTDPVYSVAISPDGTKVASGSHDNTLRLWDVATGSQITEPLQGHTDSVESVAFSPDGTKLVSGSWDNTVRLWDVTTGSQITEPLQGHTNFVLSVAFSPDGTKLVSGSWDNTVRLWDVATGTQITEPLQGHTNWVHSVAFSPDGTRVASASRDNTLRLWDVATGTQITELQGHINSVCSVTFSPDGTKLASGSHDNTLRLWDVATGSQIMEPLQGHTHWHFANSRNDINTSWTLDDKGWVYFPGQAEGTIWIPPQFRDSLLWKAENTCIISKEGYNKISFDECVYGEDWAKCYCG